MNYRNMIYIAVSVYTTLDSLAEFAQWYVCLFVCLFMVLNATFNNILAIS
jgi:hypothetical protein